MTRHPVVFYFIASPEEYSFELRDPFNDPLARSHSVVLDPCEGCGPDVVFDGISQGFRDGVEFGVEDFFVIAQVEFSEAPLVVNLPCYCASAVSPFEFRSVGCAR